MIEIRVMMRTYQRIEDLVDEVKGSYDAKNIQAVHFCSVPAMEELGIMERIDALCDELGSIPMDLSVKDEAQLLVDLDGGDFDLTFCSNLKLDFDLYQTYTYCKQNFAAFLSTSHPLAEKSSLHIHELSPYNLVLPARESMLLTHCIKSFDKHNIQPNIALTTNRVNIAMGYVKYNPAIYMGLNLERPILNPETHRKIPLVDGPWFEYVFAHKKDAILSKATQMFLHYMLEHKPK